MSSPGNSARRCGPKTSPTRWNWRSRHQAAIRRRSSISHGCCPTTDPAMSPATWPNGSMIRAGSMSVAHLTIPRPKARSSAGTRPSRTRSLPENHYLTGDLEAQFGAFVEHYNRRRYHDLTPADVYFGRGQTILLERERIKRQAIEHRRLQHRHAAA